MNLPLDVPRHQLDGLHRLETLRKRRAYERRFLPFLKTIVDFDIACEIGYHQLAGCALTVKQLLLLSLAPPATVMRRLDRLCALGVVERRRSLRDGRVHELQLSQGILQLMAEGGGAAADGMDSRQVACPIMTIQAAR
jgi:DNA-binding MarR family transcriptional regulator